MSKNIRRGLLLQAALFLLVNVSADAYSGGTGEPNDPYQIANVADFMTLANDANDYNKCFLMTADINLLGQSFADAIIAPDTNSNNNFQGTDFTGKFDGNSHKITNFTINGASKDYLGLFGQINTNGEVKNLGIEDCNIGGSGGTEFAGGLAGYNRGSISNCYSIASVSGSRSLGGLVGYNYNGNINHCYSTAIISGVLGSMAVGNLGGLAGETYYGSISYCYSTADVCGITNPQNVGGLVGYVQYADINYCNSGGSVSGTWSVGGLIGASSFDSSISHSYSNAAVNGRSYDSYNIGGLIGNSEYGNWNGDSNNITYCYSTGPVAGYRGVGGLVGQNRFSGIVHCYSASSVKGSSGSQYVGGLVGYVEQGSISNCYSTGLVSGSSLVGGLIGYLSFGSGVSGSFWDTESSGQAASAGGTGKTTPEMKTLSTFTSAGWDFVQTWNIEENQSYPFFKIYLEGDINRDGEVDFYDFAILASQWLQ